MLSFLHSTMKLTRCFVSSAIVALSLNGLLCAAQVDRPYERDPRFQRAWKKAQDRLNSDKRMRYQGFVEADKVSGGKCVECKLTLLRLFITADSLKGITKQVDQLLSLPLTADEHAEVQTLHAEAFLNHVDLPRDGDAPADQLLTNAANAVDDAEKASPRFAPSYFLQGRVLAAQRHDAAASAAFQHFLELADASDGRTVLAKRFQAHPALSLQHFAPTLIANDQNGQRFNLADQRGVVVLLDFWATWCGPCREDLRRIRDLVKQSHGRRFMVVSISEDDDEKSWRRYIDREKMGWFQLHDRNFALQTAFGVRAYPSYLLIDGEGRIIARSDTKANDYELKSIVPALNAALNQTPHAAP